MTQEIDDMLNAARSDAWNLSPNQGPWADSFKIRVAALKKDMRVHRAASLEKCSAMRLAEALANTSVSLDDCINGAKQMPWEHGVRSSHIFNDLMRD